MTSRLAFHQRKAQTLTAAQLNRALDVNTNDPAQFDAYMAELARRERKAREIGRRTERRFVAAQVWA